MNPTNIEYLDFTWNILTGCLGPNSDGQRCSYCYAHRLANGRLKSLYLSHRFQLAGDMRDPFAPRFWRYRLEEPLARHKPARIGVAFMGDLFGSWVPKATHDLIFDVINRCRQHTFLLLTNQPQNLIKWSPFPENCWVGVTATNHDSFLKAAVYLLYVEASVKFISFEPLLGGIGDALWPEKDKWTKHTFVPDWVIIGAQTKPYKPPEQKWVREIVEAADKAAIPVFLKNNLLPMMKASHIPSWVRENLRQEFPVSLTAPSANKKGE